MSARDAILAALARPRDTATVDAEALALIEAVERPFAIADPLATFVAALALPSIGATVERIADSTELPGRVAAYAAANGLAMALTLADPDLPGDWSGFSLAERPPVDGGIVVARAVAAVAETGSLILETGPARPMLANFLALHHVVVVDAATIVPVLEDIPAPDPMPRARYWVTGVSGTTDIEGQYVRGAHGPRFLHVMIVDA